MNEFVAPGIFVEEISGPRPIEGVPTSTTGFVGATSVGPTEEPMLVQSITELEATFGEPCRLVQAGRAFFANGGRRLYVQPVAEGGYERASAALERVPEIALVAAPGMGMAELLVAHATRCNRFALVDPPKGQTVDGVLAWRKRIYSRHAAVYFPWLRSPDGVAPPSGFLAGLYARLTESARDPLSGVGVERALTRDEISLLVANGINPLH